MEIRVVANHVRPALHKIAPLLPVSYTHLDVYKRQLSGFRRCLAQGGLVLSTFIPPEMLGQTAEFATDGWTYPNCVSYRRETVLDFIRAADLVGRELPWFHPRQRWFAMAHSQYDLPSTADDIHLSGAVLRASDLRG